MTTYTFYHGLASFTSSVVDNSLYTCMVFKAWHKMVQSGDIYRYFHNIVDHAKCGTCRPGLKVPSI